MDRKLLPNSHPNRDTRIEMCIRIRGVMTVLLIRGESLLPIVSEIFTLLLAVIVLTRFSGPLARGLFVHSRQLMSGTWW